MIEHELEWLEYFWRIADGVGMPEFDFLTVWDAFLKTILPLRYKTRLDGSPWPSPPPREKEDD